MTRRSPTPDETAGKAPDRPPEKASRRKPPGRARAAAPEGGSDGATAEAPAPARKPRARRERAAEGAAEGPPPRRTRGRSRKDEAADASAPKEGEALESDVIRVRRMHRRDINRAWEFLKLVFRDVNQKTVEYQRPRSKQRFVESYDDDGVEQLLFEAEGDIVGYAEVSFEVTGSDNWINPRYFESRDMRPMFVEELASHPSYQGRGVGSFMLEQLDHLARLRGCTHLVLEVAENNQSALAFYRKRNFFKLDAALFLAQKVDREPELLPPRALKARGGAR
jgi:ribosomal protein S18 acetylase RimI-like enzyme